MQELLVVVETDEDVLGILAHVGIKEAGVDADEHGNDDEGDEEEQTRQQEEIACGGFPPHEGPAHSGTFWHGYDSPFLIFL